MNEIKAVIFDVGGVLHESNTVVSDSLVQELNLEKSVLEDIWATQMPLLGSGQIDETEFWRQVHDEYGVRHVDAAENLLGNAFAEALKPKTAVLDLVKALGDRGVTLAVLSNTIEPHARALRDAGIYEGFDRLFLSHEVGMRKPDVAMYEHVLTELHVAPNETVFIDDDSKNVAAAEAIGMHGIFFTSQTELETAVQDLMQHNS